MVKVSQEDFDAAMDCVKDFYKIVMEEKPSVAHNFLEGMCVVLVALYAGENSSDEGVLLLAHLTVSAIKADVEGE